MVIRPLYAHERPLFAAHLKRLPEDDRRCRFARAGVSDEWIESYVTAIPAGDLILAALGRDGMVGAAHLALSGRVAEVGLSVEPDHRAEGIGSDLFAQAVTVARNRRAGELFTVCLSGNRAMLALARRTGMVMHHEAGEAQARLELPPPDPLSVGREVASGLFAMAHDWAALVDVYGSLLARAVPDLPPGPGGPPSTNP